MKKLKFTFLGIVILCTFLFVAFLTYSFVEPKVYDFMVRNVLTQKLPFDNNKNIYGHDDVVLVIIDNKSIEKYRWPWKRDLNNKIFDYFKEYTKPKVLVHDSIFTTFDKDNPEADLRFFKSISKFDNLVEGMAFRTSAYTNEKQGEEYDKIITQKYKLNNIEAKTELPSLYSSIMISPEIYLNAVENMASITIMPGFFDGYWTQLFGDEVYRTEEYITNYKGSLIPSIAMKAFLVANNNPKIIIDDKHIYIPELNYKINYIKTPWLSIVPVKFYKLRERGYSHIKYSAVDIMDSYDLIKAGKKPIINPDVFKNKMVVFGANALLSKGLNDNGKTSMAIDQSLADYQATVIDNLIHNDFLKVLPGWANILITVFCMLLVYYTIRTHKLVKAINNTFLILLVIMFAVSVCFYYGIITNLITPIVMCVMTMIIAYIHRYVIEADTKEKVENAMSRYMSEDVMKDVIKNIDNLGLGGKKAVVTVLFSDIRGFTSMSENMTAQEVSQLLNEYFSEMEPIVTKYRGIINKFIGDAVMAVFGEPIQDENHPINAVKCGYEMLQKVEDLNEKWIKEGKPAIKIGVGINTGEVFVGNIGSEKRMEYTVIGDTVNLASRLESYNKTYKTKILISSATYQKSQNFLSVNKISDVEIRGKAEKMDIYEVTDIRD